MNARTRTLGAYVQTLLTEGAVKLSLSPVAFFEHVLACVQNDLVEVSAVLIGSAGGYVEQHVAGAGNRLGSAIGNALRAFAGGLSETPRRRR